MRPSGRFRFFSFFFHKFGLFSRLDEFDEAFSPFQFDNSDVDDSFRHFLLAFYIDASRGLSTMRGRKRRLRLRWVGTTRPLSGASPTDSARDGLG